MRIRTDVIVREEFIARRQAVLEALGGAAAAVFAGEGSPPLLGAWRADRHFLYLTGIESEPGAAVLFDPSAEDPNRRIVLLLRPMNTEMEHWDGYREPLSVALKEKTGFTHVARANGLPGLLTGAARRTKKLACLHSFATYPAAVSPDLAVFKQVTERVPGVAIEDKTTLLSGMRALKSPAELDLIRKAISATVEGYDAALKVIQPGVTERTVAETLEAAYRRQGGEHAYNPIVGTGINATVLHYMDNSETMQDGELVLIDSGASYAGYAADVTRTFPVSGKFTDEQRKLYEAVLASEEAAIAKAGPGIPLYEVDRAARKVLEEAGYPDGYVYGIGHPLGLDVHDVSADGTLRPGMVITIEPGLYLADKKTGVRIEDDILITENGTENLTAAIPKSVAEIERIMGGQGG
jgi:Xaa-Pro aminopeptidase